MFIFKLHPLASVSVLLGASLIWNQATGSATTQSSVASMPQKSFQQATTITTLNSATNFSSNTNKISKIRSNDVFINPVLHDLMRVIVEQGLANGTYTLSTLPVELRQFLKADVESNITNNSPLDEDAAEKEAARIADIEAQLNDENYVPPEPEFICPDPNDLGPYWQGSHAQMILEEKGCPTH